MSTLDGKAKELGDDEKNEDNTLDEKSAKKVLKAQKKAEKLAKLEAKKEAQKITPKSAQETTNQTINKPKSSGGYDPGFVEAKWTEYWLSHETFRPVRMETAGVFSMCIPPPNITGSLHTGHAMMISVEDCIVRYKRLNGYEVLYLPGLDHAGIATQSVVLKNMKRTDVDRDTFMKAAHEWSEKYGHRICEQFNRMGTSLDYSRKRFTLDNGACRAVSRAFCELYKKGLIYRDNRIVAWCGKLKTTVSDLEVNYKEVEGGSEIEVDGGKYRFGMMYYIKYPITLEKDVKYTKETASNLPYVIVGTTRPETILGDSAVCINPEDKRFSNVDGIFKSGAVEDPFNLDYKNNEEVVEDKTTSTSEAQDKNTECQEIKAERKNKFKVTRSSADDVIERHSTLFAVNPLTFETIPVIFDRQAELGFGTGILKVTPAHDPVDFKLGKKHGLKFNTIFNPSNRVSHSKYAGMSRFDARLSAVTDLKMHGMFIKEEQHTQIMPFCSRSNDIIEFTVKEQWWCDCKGMAEKAIEGVRSGDIEIIPSEAKAVWYRWLENIKDWCLSRQLWWGHRVPAYYSEESGEWIVAEDEEIARKIAEEKGYGEIKQDEDVLDTWFSSGLWPFSTMGWPDETEDMKRYFPNSMLETGGDILFFWVARMVMLSYELTGKRPFEKVLLHGMVRDAHGRKMSKSLGNVIDPLHVIEGIELKTMIEELEKGNLDKREVRRATDALKKDFPQGIPRCGADALRFTLLSYTNGMKDVNLDILRVQGYSKMCNKLWNAYKFISGICGDVSTALSEVKIQNGTELSVHHQWMFSRLNTAIRTQHECFETFNFLAGTQSVYQLLYDFCDNIIEVSKTPSPEDRAILKFIFISIVKLFNPYIPFITEEIHFRLCSCVMSDYPVAVKADMREAGKFQDILELAKVCRTNDSVTVQRMANVMYLKHLVKKTVNIVDSINDGFETIGDLKYKITA